MGRKYVALDDSQTVFFNRQIEFVKTKTYDKKYPALKARQLFPVTYQTPSGFPTVTYYTWDAVGMAKIVADGAKDLPRVDVNGKATTAQVRSIGDSYGYTLTEIRLAQQTGVPLNQRKANAAKQAAYMLEDEIALSGDDDYGLIGLNNHPNIPDIAIPSDGTGASSLWSTKTADQIIRDIDLLVMSIVTVSLDTEMPDTVVLPLSQRNLIANKPYSAYTGQSVLQWYLANSQYIRNFETWTKLTGKGAGGTDLMFAYTKDPDKVELECPQEFEQLPVQEEGLEFKVPCHMRTGGLSVYYPLSFAKADGI